MVHIHSLAGEILILIAFLLSFALAAPTVPLNDTHGYYKRGSPVVVIPCPTSTITGSTNTFLGVFGGDIESFRGIPFALPPVGQLRFKPPQPLPPTSGGKVDASGDAPVGCPQYLLPEKIQVDGLPEIDTSLVLGGLPVGQTLLQGKEDCLTLDIQRPAGTKADAKLPVMVWIFGGGFELGNTVLYDGASLIAEGVTLGKPFVFVTMNYRTGGFGFMPGKEILADGSSNVGLLDQRLAMQWVADNIASFGGDPDRVSLWGESAGSISIYDQMVMFNGNITYKDKALFRGAIMSSGSIVPTDRIDSPKAQAIYDTVVKNAGCAVPNTDTLACLRALDFDKLVNATNSVPGILSFNAVALSYLPRPDGTVLVDSPHTIDTRRNIAPVPYIIGDQEDEGTLFTLFVSNLTSPSDIQSYLSSLYFQKASQQQLQQFISTYPDSLNNNSPSFNKEFGRISTMLGDATFTLNRRVFLNISSIIQPQVPSYSYLSSYGKGTPILGTFHGSDLLKVFRGILPNSATSSLREYYINFLYNLDPNDNSGGVPGGKVTTLRTWPKWSEGQQLLQLNADDSAIIADNFRQQSFDFIFANQGSLLF